MAVECGEKNEGHLLLCVFSHDYWLFLFFFSELNYLDGVFTCLEFKLCCVLMFISLNGTLGGKQK